MNNVTAPPPQLPYWGPATKGLRVTWRASVPLTHRFLSITLRFAFAKQKFQRMEEIHRQFLAQAPHGRALAAPMQVLEQTFPWLRRELKGIEERKSKMVQAIVANVQELMDLHLGFSTWLTGFMDGSNAPKSPLTLLNLGSDTTMSIKILVADFLGAPTGPLLHDLRCLKRILEYHNGDHPETCLPEGLLTLL